MVRQPLTLITHSILSSQIQKERRGEGPRVEVKNIDIVVLTLAKGERDGRSAAFTALV